MATVLGGNQIKLNSGQTVQAQNGGWYDAQQFWNGALGGAGVGNNPNQTDIYGKSAPTFNSQDAAYVKQQQQVQPAQPAQPSQPATTPQPTDGGGAGGGIPGLVTPATINLPQLYEGLYANSGIRETEAQLNDKTNQYNDAVSKIQNNPYLSEGTMTGRISKLDAKYQADKQAAQQDIAMKKADIETNLNLQTKQFDINSQQAKQAMDQFQSLLGSGALQNATGEDIANLTRSTGLSSSMIQSAIKAQNDKNTSTSTIQFDDGKNQGFLIINDKTGQVINKQIIGASKPKGASATATKEQEQTQNISNLTQSVKNGITLKSLINAFYPALSKDDIYAAYNQYSPFGQAKESLDDIKQGKFVT